MITKTAIVVRGVIDVPDLAVNSGKSNVEIPAMAAACSGI
jgi:hypothetical protein